MTLLDIVRRFAGPLVVALVAVIFALLVWSLRQQATGRAARIGAARDQGALVSAQAGEAVSGAAAEATAALGIRALNRVLQEQETRHEVLTTPDAGVSAGAAGAAGLAGLCRRAVYRDDPGCAELRGAGSAAAAE